MIVEYLYLGRQIWSAVVRFVRSDGPSCVQRAQPFGGTSENIFSSTVAGSVFPPECVSQSEDRDGVRCSHHV